MYCVTRLNSFAEIRRDDTSQHEFLALALRVTAIVTYALGVELRVAEGLVLVEGAEFGVPAIPSEALDCPSIRSTLLRFPLSRYICVFLFRGLPLPF
jgi:hypothetical protein